MKSNLYIGLLFLLSLSFNGKIFSIDINIITEEWAPYNYMEDDKLKGFSVEIVKYIADELDINYSIGVYPSLRATTVLNTTPMTMFFSMFRTPERENLYKWIGPLGDGSITFYKRADSDIPIQNLEEVKKAGTIACRNGGLITRLLLSEGFDNLDTGATGSIGVYVQLLKGRCDLAISDTDLGMRHYLRQLGEDPNQLQKLPFNFFEEDIYIACSKDIPDDIIIRWQNILDRMKMDGTYNKIYLKYNL